MYSQIASNKRRTALLVTAFTVVIVALGWAVGEQTGIGPGGMVAAAMLAAAMNLVGYYAGDAVALSASGARRVEKRDAPELWNLVENLAISSGLPMPRLYVINDQALNAFATGRDPAHASVAVTVGLVERLTRPELEGVIAHELSHIKNYDIRLMTVTVVLVGLVMLLSDWLLRGALFGRDDRDAGQAGPVLMLVGVILAVLSPILAELIKLAVSRQREYLADASGALMTRYPEGLASALEKIAREDRPLRQANHATAHLFLANPFDPHVTKKFERLFSTHPPIEERIKRLKAMGV
jgi:heat shock protein HtpX